MNCCVEVFKSFYSEFLDGVGDDDSRDFPSRIAPGYWKA